MRGNANFVDALNQPVKRMEAELTINGTDIGNEDIISVDFSYEGSLLHTCMTKLELELKTDNLSQNTVFGFKGNYVTRCLIKVNVISDPLKRSEVFETMDIAEQYGQFKVYDVEISGKRNTAKLICYDRMIEAMTPIVFDSDFDNEVSEYEYFTPTGWVTVNTISVNELIRFICNKLNWDKSQLNIANIDVMFNADEVKTKYTSAEDSTTTSTYRDMLDDIAEVTGCVISIGGWYAGYSKPIRLKAVEPYWDSYVKDKETVNIVIGADKLTDIDYKKTVDGVNKLQIVDYSEGVLAEIEDASEIEANGVNAVVITGNRLLNGKAFHPLSSPPSSAAEMCKQGIFDALTDGNVLVYNPFTYKAFACGYFPECGSVISATDINDKTVFIVCLNFAFHYGDGVYETMSCESIKNSGDDVYDSSSQTLSNTVEIASLTNDSGWNDVDYESNFSHYSSSQKLQYKKYGNLVEVRGVAKALQTLSMDISTSYQIGTIDYAPSADIVEICHGSTTAIWRLIINSSGELYLSRYRNETGYISVPTNAWLAIHTTFLLD